MKKKILLTSAAILAFASVNLVVSCNEEKIEKSNFPKTPEEQKYEQLFSKYKEKYVGTDNYVFDDFEEFDFNNHEYYDIVDIKKLKELNSLYEDRELSNFNNQNIYWYFKDENIEKFYSWVADYNYKFKVYKDVIDKFAPNKKIKQNNNKEDIYLVKESNFNFNFTEKKEEYLVAAAISSSVLEEMISLPNVSIKGYFALLSPFVFSPYKKYTYLSNLNMISNFSLTELNKGDSFKIFSTTKPKIEKLIPDISKKEIDKFNSSEPIINLKTTFDFGLKSKNDLNDWYNIENDLNSRENAQIIANQDSENFYDYDLTFSRERKVRDYDVKTDERREYIEKDSIHFILSRPLKIISTEGKNEKRRG
ncbi:hypothetical protein [Mycoplasma sp. 1012]